jgi:hypothetical protein
MIYRASCEGATALCSARAPDMACSYLDTVAVRPASDDEIREAKCRGDTLLRAGFLRISADERRWASM